jgi:hypothetical protein
LNLRTAAPVPIAAGPDVEALYLELVETLPPANRAELARLLLEDWHDNHQVCTPVGTRV